VSRWIAASRVLKWLKHRLEMDTVERREKERRQDNRIRVRSGQAGENPNTAAPTKVDAIPPPEK
jgi:hypothetical protein